MVPPHGACVWGCGSGLPFNREHIIGWQIANAVGMRFPIQAAWGETEVRTGRNVPGGERIEPDHSIVLDDRVCIRCNGKWMKRLDDLTTNCLRPALEREEAVELNPKKRSSSLAGRPRSDFYYRSGCTMRNAATPRLCTRENLLRPQTTSLGSTATPADSPSERMYG